MSTQLCRQVSIDAPGRLLAGQPTGSLVASAHIPVPATPPGGARIKVIYAGACYRRPRSHSLCSQSSAGSVGSTNGGRSSAAELTDSLHALKLAMLAEAAACGAATVRGGHAAAMEAEAAAAAPVSTAALQLGERDGALFPGFEVAGVIDQLGEAVTGGGFRVGQRVCLYPFDETPDAYAGFVVVPELRYLVPVPDELPLSVAAMLPTGALLAWNSVAAAHQLADQLLAQRSAAAAAAGGVGVRGAVAPVRILIVGTGGLALWALRIAAHQFAAQLAEPLQRRQRVRITVASLRDEGLQLARSLKNVSVVQWTEDLHEAQLVERTRDACGGPLDVVIDFGTTARSLQRSLRCLAPAGVVLVSEERAERLLPRLADDGQGAERVRAVRAGTVEQLQELVRLVAGGEIEVPPHSVYPCEEAQLVVQRLCRSEIAGRAILRFHDVE